MAENNNLAAVGQPSPMPQQMQQPQSTPMQSPTNDLAMDLPADNNVDSLNPEKMSALSKFFFGLAAAFILNKKKTNMVLRGTLEQQKAVQKALENIKGVLSDLKQGKSVEEVKQTLGITQEDMDTFEKVTGQPYPLK